MGMEGFSRGWPFQGQPINTDFDVNWDSEQSRGLVAWWPTVNAAQSGILDRVSGLQQGSASGTPALLNDPVRGRVGSFDGTNGWRTPSTPSGGRYDPNVTGAFTVSIWVNLSTSYVNGTSYGICSRTLSNYQDVSVSWILYRPGWGSDYRFVVGDGVNPEISTDSVNVTYGEWQHIAGVWDGAQITCYANGVPGASKNQAAINAVTARIVMSGYSTSLNNQSAEWLGELADFRLRNRAMTPTEIYDEYTNPWELYAPRIYRPMVYAAVAPSVIIPITQHHRQQQGAM